jgi:hypothetical protein
MIAVHIVLGVFRCFNVSMFRCFEPRFLPWLGYAYGASALLTVESSPSSLGKQSVTSGSATVSAMLARRVLVHAKVGQCTVCYKVGEEE